MSVVSPLEISALGPVRPPAEAVLAAAERRESQGFDAVWWADHLLHWFPDAIWTPDLVPQAERQPSPHVWMDPFAMIAAAAQRTSEIRLGVGVTDLVRNHPAQIARAALTLDHLTEGRFVLGIGSGESLNLSPYGLPADRPVSRLEEGVEIIRRFFADAGPLDFEGEHFRLSSASVGLRPVGDDPPPIWIAAHRPRGLRLVGGAADGWLPFARTPELYTEMLQDVHAAARAAGRDPDAITPGLYARIVVAESDEQAVQAIDASFLMRFIALTLPDESFQADGAQHPLGEGVFGLTTFLPTELDRTTAERLAGAVPVEVMRSAAVHGTPDQISAQLSRFVEAGARHIQLTNLTPLVAPPMAARSEELMGEAISALRALEAAS
ncbi:MAG: LLM class flavin-dependent oxidoreductase [Thermoleophilia bacterium]|nr:LLM class flavin-dependent oxidoreductase [Thermoleophilia bacterium]